MFLCRESINRPWPVAGLRGLCLSEAVPWIALSQDSYEMTQDAKTPDQQSG